MDFNRFEDSLIIKEYLQSKLSDEEKEAFEDYIIKKFMMRNLSEEQEKFFGELYLSSQPFFEKVKNTEKITIGIQDAFRRGAINFFGPVDVRSSLLEKLKFFFSSPGLVAVTMLLIFALIYPVWQMFQLKHELRNLQKPFAISAKSYALNPSDDALRGEATEIYLAEEDRIFLLNFNLPEKVIAEHQYSAQILDQNKNVIWKIKDLKPIDRYETFSIVCYKRMFNEGKYLLRVFELSKEGEKTGKDYMYSFRLINEKTNKPY